MKIGVLSLSHPADAALVAAIERAHLQPVPFAAGLDGYVLVGDLSTAPTARFELLQAMYDILPVLLAENALGKPILGIGSGAQLLVESGIVPGLENNKVGIGVQVSSCDPLNMTLSLSPYYQRNVFTQYVAQTASLAATFDQVSARFVMSDALLNEINAQGLTVFENAITNKMGNALAVLPRVACDAFFQSMALSLKQSAPVPNEAVPLYYYPRPIQLTHYKGEVCRPASLEERMALQALLPLVDISLTVSASITAHNIVITSLLRSDDVPVLWSFANSKDWAVELQKLLKSNVLYHPCTHQAFSYTTP